MAEWTRVQFNGCRMISQFLSGKCEPKTLKLCWKWMLSPSYHRVGVMWKGTEVVQFVTMNKWGDVTDMHWGMQNIHQHIRQSTQQRIVPPELPMALPLEKHKVKERWFFFFFFCGSTGMERKQALRRETVKQRWGRPQGSEGWWNGSVPGTAPVVCRSATPHVLHSVVVWDVTITLQ